MNKTLLRKGFACITALTIATSVGVLAFAQDRDEPRREPPLEIHIYTNNTALVRGAHVTAISGTTITATTALGSTTLTWMVLTDTETHFIRRNGGASALSEVAVGDRVSFRGGLVADASTLTVRARQFKDFSNEKISATIAGTVKEVNTADMRFVLSTTARGTVVVKVTASTTIFKGETTAFFSDIAVGARAEVRGALDAGNNVMTAERIRLSMREPEKQVLQGSLKSIEGTTAPTTFILSIGGIDYMVKVAADTSILNVFWLRTSLANFHAGDTVRVYGAVSGTTIDATVVRDVSIRI